MDTGIVFALVLTVLFFGGLVWLVIHARKQEKKDSTLTGKQLPAVAQSRKKRAA